MLARRTVPWLLSALLIAGAAGCSGEKPGADAAAPGSDAPAATEASEAEATATGTMTPAAVLELLDHPDAPAILDVRSAKEFDEGHIPGAILVPYDELPRRIAELEPYRERGLVVYCRTGRRAGIAEDALARAGFERVWDLEGHMVEWRRQGLPLAVPAVN